jgi:hypothetical protein
MHENGMTDAEVAKAYGVDRGAVYKARMRGWKSGYCKDGK